MTKATTPDDRSPERAPWETDPNAWKGTASPTETTSRPIVAPDDDTAVLALIRQTQEVA